MAKKKNMLATYGSDVNGITGEGPITDDDQGGVAVSADNAPDASTVAPQDTSGLPNPQAQGGGGGSVLPPRPQVPPPGPPQPPAYGPAGGPPASAAPPAGPPAAPPPQLPPQNPLMQRLASSIIKPEPTLPQPNIWRQIAGSFIPNRTIGNLVTYGPQGMQQLQQHDRWEKTLPDQVRLADTLQQTQERAEAAAASRELTAEQRTETARKNAADEAERAKKDEATQYDRQVQAYNAALNKVHESMGQPIGPLAPGVQPPQMAPGSTQIQVYNPYTKTNETYEMPSVDEAAKRKYQAETEPTPQYIKDKFPGVPDRMKAPVIAEYTKAIQSGDEAKARDALTKSIHDQADDTKRFIAGLVDSRQRDAQTNKPLPGDSGRRAISAKTTMDQVQTAIDAINDLKTQHPELIGSGITNPVTGIRRWYETKTGTEPAEMGAVDTALESVASLQPGQHNFRSAQAVENFKKALGIDLRTNKYDPNRAWLINPDKAIQALQSVRDFNKLLRDNIYKEAGRVPPDTEPSQLPGTVPGAPQAPAGKTPNLQDLRKKYNY